MKKNTLYQKKTTARDGGNNLDEKVMCVKQYFCNIFARGLFVGDGHEVMLADSNGLKGCKGTRPTVVQWACVAEKRPCAAKGGDLAGK